MTRYRARPGCVLTLVCVALASCRSAPAQSTIRSRIAFVAALPQLDGTRLEVKVVEVTYGPGESSTPHRHPCAVIGYVLEGAVRMQVKGEPQAIYKPGDSFYEAPNGVHLISANASDKERARFLAYFVCDHQTPLSVALPDTSK